MEHSKLRLWCVETRHGDDRPADVSLFSCQVAGNTTDNQLAERIGGLFQADGGTGRTQFGFLCSYFP